MRVCRELVLRLASNKNLPGHIEYLELVPHRADEGIDRRLRPEKPIIIEWPDAIYVDRGLVGGGRLAWPDQADERTVPDWLVFGAAIRTFSLRPQEAGLHPLSTALAEESFGDASAERLVEGFARHLMVAFDRWQEDGFGPIACEYIAKMKSQNGVHHAIGENGDLGIRRAGERTERWKLLPALKVPSWLDSRTGEPRL